MNAKKLQQIKEILLKLKTEFKEYFEYFDFQKFEIENQKKLLITDLNFKEWLFALLDAELITERQIKATESNYENLKETIENNKVDFQINNAVDFAKLHFCLYAAGHCAAAAAQSGDALYEDYGAELLPFLIAFLTQNEQPRGIVLAAISRAYFESVLETQKITAGGKKETWQSIKNKIVFGADETDFVQFKNNRILRVDDFTQNQIISALKLVEKDFEQYAKKHFDFKKAPFKLKDLKQNLFAPLYDKNDERLFWILNLIKDNEIILHTANCKENFEMKFKNANNFALWICLFSIGIQMIFECLKLEIKELPKIPLPFENFLINKMGEFEYHFAHKVFQKAGILILNKLQYVEAQK